MTFEEAWALVLAGKRVRRRGWRPGVSISVKAGNRFVTMTVHFETLNRDDYAKEWQPYAIDFHSNDWELVPDFIPKVGVQSKRTSRYNREPVI